VATTSLPSGDTTGVAHAASEEYEHEQVCSALAAGSIVVAAAAVLAACASEAPLGLDGKQAFPDHDASSNFNRVPDLGDCDSLKAPVASRVAFHVYAKGVQIYRWNGASWSFVGPSAVLTADANGKSTVGTHYSGPTWESMSGGKVVGAVLKRCTPDPNAIPWLLLRAASTEGPGVFREVTFIQRVNTVGGNAPSAPGSVTGEEKNVPYATEYFFYKAE